MSSDEITDAIRERLAQIAEANGGRLTPEAVVKDAKQKDSPLHSKFPWDVKQAAYQHWLDVARRLIVSVQVVIKTEHTRVRTPYYVRDPAAGSSEQGYVSVAKLRTEADMARDVLVAEFGRVADMLRRARNLAVALNAEPEVDALITKVVGLRQTFIDGAQQSAMQ